MAPSFKLQPADEAFFASAPFVMRETFKVPRPAAAVWDELTGEHPLYWCRILDGTWTSPRPFGVGTTRQMKVLRGAVVLQERYFRWEEGRRHSFYVAEASAPLFKRFAEDYEVVPAGETACRFTWTIAVEPRLPGPLADPPNRLLLGSLFRDTRRHYGI